MVCFSLRSLASASTGLSPPCRHCVRLLFAALRVPGSVAWAQGAPVNVCRRIRGLETGEGRQAGWRWGKVPAASNKRAGDSCASCLAWDSGRGQKAVEKGSPGRKGTGERGTGDEEERKSSVQARLSAPTPQAEPGSRGGRRETRVWLVGEATDRESVPGAGGRV